MSSINRLLKSCSPGEKIENNTMWSTFRKPLGSTPLQKLQQSQQQQQQQENLPLRRDRSASANISNNTPHLLTNNIENITSNSNNNTNKIHDREHAALGDSDDESDTDSNVIHHDDDVDEDNDFELETQEEQQLSSDDEEDETNDNAISKSSVNNNNSHNISVSQNNNNNISKKPNNSNKQLPAFQAVDATFHGLTNHGVSVELLKKVQERVAERVTKQSQRSYLSNMHSITKRNYEFTVKGMMEFLISEEQKDLEISNQTLECILAAFKYYYFTNNLQVLPNDVQDIFKQLLAARKRQHPDQQRVTGAMNEARTLLFEAFIERERSQGRISPAHADLFKDVAWTLYACALRVFQLKLLQPDSFYFAEADVYGSEPLVKSYQYFVKVIAKGAERMNKVYEKKQVHPKFASAIKKIVEKRIRNTWLFYDFGDNEKNKFSSLVEAAAKFYNWPSEHRFRGTHMFRHGAAQDAFVESKGDLFLVQLRTGHMSKKAAQHYAYSDLERTQQTLLKGDKKEEMIASKIKEINSKVTHFFKGKLVAANKLKTVLSTTNSKKKKNPNQQMMMMMTVTEDASHKQAAEVDEEDSDDDEFGKITAAVTNERMTKLEFICNNSKKSRRNRTSINISSSTSLQLPPTLTTDTPTSSVTHTTISTSSPPIIIMMPQRFSKTDQGVWFYDEEGKLFQLDSKLLNDYNIRKHPSGSCVMAEDMTKVKELIRDLKKTL